MNMGRFSIFAWAENALDDRRSANQLKQVVANSVLRPWRIPRYVRWYVVRPVQEWFSGVVRTYEGRVLLVDETSVSVRLCDLRTNIPFRTEISWDLFAPEQHRDVVVGAKVIKIVSRRWRFRRETLVRILVEH